ncbi:RagB/SusD family nutrient uptake outer membrane protein [Mucilaginibacter polytrichastri]|uniref:RagB/SusD domain-containing protein n=1 Tax=Mucilaginibacter polytrichastri TaxID=1302689 RepID=A0A1Q6A116_9SPHI|nr:RagB/SusD family nutrient uptake outer membrane protein [Mucilaginibacter polytrichastri]OKS87688.1 hypothetical protein RG47T_3150 [Mucilaginibacter polytrichastri]SFT20173.1 Starch-binding associating with outer membrane [Mucilaginibacter polytrichastri]
MKKSIYKIIIPGTLALLSVSYSCKNYLDKAPTGVLNSAVLANKAGVEGLLIGAYSLLDGVYQGQPVDAWETSVDNWSFGGIASDDAYKGSNPTDQPYAAEIMTHTTSSVNEYVLNKWKNLYNGIQRANDVLRELPMVTDGSIDATYKAQLIGEARFLRGVYELEASKIWRNIPYVDETITYDAGNFNVGNPGPIWDKIEADFAAAVASLPTKQAQIGRVNKYAAEAYLAKAYMFDHKYDLARTALTDVITNGITSGGAKYALEPFANNFNPSTKNGPEAVFSVQMTVLDNANGYNGNSGDVLNYPSGGPAACCGFYQPSFSLVNSYKVDAVRGLPLLDTYNNSDLKNDQGVLATDVTWLPDSTTPLDPRLDWTVGRRGIPYLDWGIHPGASWARDQADGGPFSPIKNVYYKAQQGTTSDTYNGWAANQANSNNYNLIRFADVLLWAAECEIESTAGSVAQAVTYVNLVRARAADPTGWVKGRVTGYTGGDATKPIVDNTLPAANYKVGLYSAADFTSKDQSRKIIWFERKLELAMEGHRFFDLQRYDGLYGGPGGAGYMKNILTNYVAHDANITGFANPTLKGVTFTQGKNELYPIPQTQIDVERGALKQNPSY